MVHGQVNPAVFLDRDGVLNRNVYYSESGEWEAPRSVADFEVIPGAMDAVAALQRAGYQLFLVSNQPNMAKGKAQQADHEGIHRRLLSLFESAGVKLQEAYYCFHHPKGSVAALSGPCICRKPSPYFLRRAQKDYDLDMSHSWMIGDRDTDIECGQQAGVRTIQISEQERRELPRNPDYVAPSIVEAAGVILRNADESIGEAPVE